MLVDRFQPRDAEHPENLGAVAARLGTELAVEAQLGAQPHAAANLREQFWTADGRTYRNVIAHYGPESDELVVVGAHYDTCGPLPGADDDASGVAGLIELGRLLAAQPPPLAVELVAYSLEEPPYFGTPEMGSVHHADLVARSGKRVRAMLSLEMIGYFSDEPGSQSYPSGLVGAVYPDRGSYVAVVGNLGQISLVQKVRRAMEAAAVIPVESINAPESLSGVDLSDHRSYWARGFPAVMITDTAFLRNPNYHQASDTPETLDYARMAAVVTAVHRAVWALASER